MTNRLSVRRRRRGRARRLHRSRERADDDLGRDRGHAGIVCMQRIHERPPDRRSALDTAHVPHRLSTAISDPDADGVTIAESGTPVVAHLLVRPRLDCGQAPRREIALEPASNASISAIHEDLGDEIAGAPDELDPDIGTKPQDRLDHQVLFLGLAAPVGPDLVIAVRPLMRRTAIGSGRPDAWVRTKRSTLPGYGWIWRTAGPPVSKENDCGPPTGAPPRALRPGFSENERNRSTNPMFRRPSI